MIIPSLRRSISPLPGLSRTLQFIHSHTTMEKNEEPPTSQNDQTTLPTLSKSAQKKLLKQERYEAKKAEKKAEMKQHKKRELERKRKEWEETLGSVGEDEREKLIEKRREVRKERMEKKIEERVLKIERLNKAKMDGLKVVIDLEFGHLMSLSQIHSLVQQVMYCYAVNGRCTTPAHLWLTGCSGEMNNQLERLPGFDKWIIEKESQSYIDALNSQKDNLVYLTADSETVLDELDMKKIYIIGGLVDRNRWKGITMKKAQEQGIQTAKLPIANYMKMSSSQVLTVNQVIEIILKYLETRDWRTSFFQVIPQRKRGETEQEEHKPEREEESEDKEEGLEIKKQCVEVASS